jgi:hypothetical protein
LFNACFSQLEPKPPSEWQTNNKKSPNAPLPRKTEGRMVLLEVALELEVVLFFRYQAKKKKKKNEFSQCTFPRRDFQKKSLKTMKFFQRCSIVNLQW